MGFENKGDLIYPDYSSQDYWEARYHKEIYLDPPSNDLKDKQALDFLTEWYL